MALSANTVWEVRPTNGSDTNGGGFVAGSGGTDYSQQNSPQATGTVTSVGTTVTATSGIFTAAMVGNLITDGTTWKWITAFTSSTVVTVDSSPSWTAASIAVGGALKTLTTLAAQMVASNKAFVKAEATITLTSLITWSQSCSPSETVPANRIIGYTTSRGDGGRVSIALSTNTGLRGFRFDGGGWIVEGFNIDCASLGSSIGIFFNNVSNNVVRNCKFSNFTLAGIYSLSTARLTVHHCEFTGGTSAATAAMYIDYPLAINNWIHDNVCPGIIATGLVPVGIIGNIISNNSGSLSDAIQIAGSGPIIGNDLYNNGRHGILVTSSGSNIPVMYIRNNVITDHTAVGASGIKFSIAALPASPEWDGNFFYNNTSNRVNMDDTTTNVIDGVAPYTNVFDKVLTASPWTDPSTNNYTLNNVAGGGAVCRGAAQPGVGGTVFSGIPGLSQSGYLDGGVFQHADPVGGGIQNQVIIVSRGANY